MELVISHSVMIDSSILEKLTPGALSFGLGVVLTMLGLNHLDEALGQEIKNMLPQLKIWWREDIRPFLWWCMCKIWMPIIPCVIGFLATVWMLINLPKIVGMGFGGMFVTFLGMLATQVVIGFGLWFFQQKFLDLLGIGSLFDTEEYERKSKETPTEPDDFYDNPNVG